MKIRFIAACCILLVGASCGAADDVASDEGPTSIPMLDTVDEASTSSESVAEATTTTEAAVTTTTSPSSTAGVSSTTAAPTTKPPTTKPPATSPQTTIDPFAPYCSSYTRLSGIDTALNPNDPAGIEAVFTALEAAWIDAESVAPAVIAGEVKTMGTFTVRLRQLLAANDYDLGAVIAEASELEQELGADTAQILVKQFGYLECDIDPDLPADETAVFYASLLNTAERRGVLADLLSENGTFSTAGAACFADRASAEVMFPLVDAPSTDDQEAALSQVLGICQLSKGGS